MRDFRQQPVVVAFVRWPEEDHRRRALAATRRPVLLLVARPGPIPTALTALEDWTYEDASPAELAARLRQLEQRWGVDEGRPRLDDGLLRRGDRWVALSPSQLPVAGLLLDNLGRVVTTEAIAAAYASAGGSTARPSIKSLHRLGLRFAVVGLRLKTVRARGAVLEEN